MLQQRYISTDSYNTSIKYFIMRLDAYPSNDKR